MIQAEFMILSPVTNDVVVQLRSRLYVSTCYVTLSFYVLDLYKHGPITCLRLSLTGRISGEYLEFLFTTVQRVLTKYSSRYLYHRKTLFN